MRPIVAADLMTPDVLSVPETMGLGELSAFLLDHQISGVVVRDEEGQPVGVVSLTDLAAVTADAADAADIGDTADSPPASNGSAFYLQAEDPGIDPAGLEEAGSAGEGLTAGDIMTPQIYSVAIDATVSEIARTLLEESLHRLLVFDDAELVGIVSVSDLLGLLIEEDG